MVEYCYKPYRQYFRHLTVGIVYQIRNVVFRRFSFRIIERTYFTININDNGKKSYRWTNKVYLLLYFLFISQTVAPVNSISPGKCFIHKLILDVTISNCLFYAHRRIYHIHHHLVIESRRINFDHCGKMCIFKSLGWTTWWSVCVSNENTFKQ